MKLISNIGFIFLALYLILIGLSTLAPNLMMHIPGIVFGVLALISGVFILVGR